MMLILRNILKYSVKLLQFSLYSCEFMTKGVKTPLRSTAKDKNGIAMKIHFNTVKFDFGSFETFWVRCYVET